MMRTTRFNFMNTEKKLAELLKTATDKRNPKEIFNFLYYDREHKKLYATNTKVLVAINNIEFTDLEDETQNLFLDITKGGHHLPVVDLHQPPSDFERILKLEREPKVSYSTAYSMVANSDKFMLAFLRKDVAKVLNILEKYPNKAFSQSENVFYIKVLDQDIEIEILMTGAEI